MSAIGPGDFVECVDAAPRSPNPRHVAAAAQLQVGGVYQVEKPGAPGINPRTLARGETLIIRGLRAINQDVGIGFAADRFRPIYRPKADLIERLLQPVKEDA